MSGAMTANHETKSLRSPRMSRPGVDSTSATTPLLSSSHLTNPIHDDDFENGEPHADNEALVNAETTASDDDRHYDGLPEARKNLKWAYPALLLGVFLCASDQTLVATSWAKIGSELHALNNASWVTTAYSATVVASHPLYGRLSDIFGRKPCILTAYILFAIGTTLCGFAGNIQELAVVRAVAGAGGGGMNSLVAMIIADAVPLRDRSAWLVYISVAWFLGASAGGPIGGLVADTIGWRWSFWGQLPLVLLAILLVSLALQEPTKYRDEDRASRLARVDILGSCLLVLAITALLLALDAGSNQGWSSGLTLGCAGIFFLLLSAFVYVELHYATCPVMPFNVVLTRGTIPIHLAGFLCMSCWFTMNMFAPLYLVAVKRYTTTEASLAMIPRSIGSLLGSVSSAQWIKRQGTYWRLAMVTWLGAALCYLGMLASTRTIFDNDTVFVILFGLSATFGGAIGATHNIAIVANSSYDAQAVNIGAMYFFKALGSVWGVSASATIVNTALRYLLAANLGRHPAADVPDATHIADRVRQDLQYISRLPMELAEIVTTCYARAVAGSFAYSCAMYLLAGVACWFIIEKPLGKVAKTSG